MVQRAGFHSFLFVTAGILALYGCAGHRQSGDIRNRVADVYGANEFNQIEELRYTFNVKIGEKQIRRSWMWKPAENQVTFKGTANQGGTVSYNRNDIKELQSEPIKQVDAWFINDSYWLLFPLHLAWDSQANVTEDRDLFDLPIGQGKAKRLVMTYPPTGGYTPGDVYELFIGSDDRLAQWIYRKGGSPTPTRMSTWEDHRVFGPLMISMERRGPDERFRVWFTDVAVRLVGSSQWIEAK
jgi:hypothetical protein